MKNKFKNKNFFDLFLSIKSLVLNILVSIFYNGIIKFSLIKTLSNFPVIRGRNGSIILGKSVRIYGQIKIVFDDMDYKGNLTIGNNFTSEGATISPRGGSIHIGDHCFIGENTIIQSFRDSQVKIGNDVMIASNCAIFGSNHKFENKMTPMNKQGEMAQGITIHNNVWIGTQSVLLDGITVGEGSIIAAGTLVNKNVPPNSIVGGIPGKIIKSR